MFKLAMTSALMGLALAGSALLADCEPDSPDNDGDGWPADVDCDDYNPAVHPGQDEPCTCNALDDDCNGVVDDFPCDFPVCDGAGQDGDLCGGLYGDCAVGLVCCYPCGIEGCDNVCMEPCDATEPWCAGGCPMYP